MELLINIADIRLARTEIEILHVIVDSDYYACTVSTFAELLGADVEDIWKDVQSLILHGLLERTNMSQTFDDVSLISIAVPMTARAWLAQNEQDIADAFVVLNPDLFELTEVAEA
jgi:hypothetical protein